MWPEVEGDARDGIFRLMDMIAPSNEIKGFMNTTEGDQHVELYPSNRAQAANMSKVFGDPYWKNFFSDLGQLARQCFIEFRIDHKDNSKYQPYPHGFHTDYWGRGSGPYFIHIVLSVPLEENDNLSSTAYE